MGQQNNGNGRGHLSQGDFILKAIDTLRAQNGKIGGTNGNGKGKGIHSVNAGLEGAFNNYFGRPLQPALDRLVAAGKVQTRATRGGYMVYLAGEAPRPTGEARAAMALKAMGLKVKVRS